MYLKIALSEIFKKRILENKKNVVDIAFFPENPFGLDELAKQNGVTADTEVESFLVTTVFRSPPAPNELIYVWLKEIIITQ